MARVTVEDCVVRVPNRFDLVMVASQRARALAMGAPLSVDRDNDKNPVVALREIADGTVSLVMLENELIRGHQKITEPEEPSEEIGELISGEQEWARTLDEAGGDDLDDLGADEEGADEEGEEPFEGELDDFGVGNVGGDKDAL